ncbi:uncharacterized protein TM35_000101710 [Trypanosoma theileri]|uniref:Uncharacterized protein n=1 Tax=Trypanosoma theileri TaxID=67003 RepID=A0A1X0NZJ2_9TRYP|nr:uncharacterized protein TM35_000101710 [Trypanosoma theileri]ORC89903.1 hypothetical protein TM35_000101710 [Trypanosoma theileri]
MITTGIIVAIVVVVVLFVVTVCIAGFCFYRKKILAKRSQRRSVNSDFPTNVNDDHKKDTKSQDGSNNLQKQTKPPYFPNNTDSSSSSSGLSGFTSTDSSDVSTNAENDKSKSLLKLWSEVLSTTTFGPLVESLEGSSSSSSLSAPHVKTEKVIYEREERKESLGETESLYSLVETSRRRDRAFSRNKEYTAEYRKGDKTRDLHPSVFDDVSYSQRQLVFFDIPSGSDNLDGFTLGETQSTADGEGDRFGIERELTLSNSPSDLLFTPVVLLVKDGSIGGNDEKYEKEEKEKEEEGTSVDIWQYGDSVNEMNEQGYSSRYDLSMKGSSSLMEKKTTLSFDTPMVGIFLLGKSYMREKEKARRNTTVNKHFFHNLQGAAQAPYGGVSPNGPFLGKDDPNMDSFPVIISTKKNEDSFNVFYDSTTSFSDCLIWKSPNSADKQDGNWLSKLPSEKKNSSNSLWSFSDMLSNSRRINRWVRMENYYNQGCADIIPSSPRERLSIEDGVSQEGSITSDPYMLYFCWYDPFDVKGERDPRREP